MEINKDEFNKWIIALRSGKYKQSHFKFQDEKGYCCLGVACEILVPNPIKKEGLLAGITTFNHNSNVPEWLSNINLNFKLKTESQIWQLNDEEKMSFDEIADCLELVYIHGMLDEENV